MLYFQAIRIGMLNFLVNRLTLQIQNNLGFMCASDKGNRNTQRPLFAYHLGCLVGRQAKGRSDLAKTSSAKIQNRAGGVLHRSWFNGVDTRRDCRGWMPIDCTTEVDGIAAHIHQRAASKMRLQTNIVWA